jgi:Domain of unknown function (DUF1996)
MMVKQAVSRTRLGALCAIIVALTSTGCPDASLEPGEVAATEAELAKPAAGRHARHHRKADGTSGAASPESEHEGHAPAAETEPAAESGDSAHADHASAADAPTPAADSGESAHTDHAPASDADEPADNDPAAPAAHAGHAPVEGAEAADDAAPIDGQGGAASAGSNGSATGDHSGHTPAPGVAAQGPYIDVAAIPMGEPGESTRNIGSTSEAPARGDGVGAFRTRCDYSHMLWDDPIVFPNQPGAAHLHAFFGNTDTDAYSSERSIKTSGNSTCRGGIANRSSYWVPALIDAAGKPVEPELIDVYYKSGYNGIEPEQIRTFPKGLRMIAGSAKSSATQYEAYWGCHNNYIGHPGSIPQCEAGDNLVMFVEFPQCWDGKNLDSADHKSHMAYTEDGACPTTHPVAIPAITFNVLYPVRDVKGWRLSSDMYSADKPGGFSAHGDWFEGWEDEVAETFVENCVQKGVDCHSHLLGNGETIF